MDLSELVAEIKKIPLKVKLDTNGMVPLALKALFGREETSPDYIAIDLKMSPERYGELLPPGEAFDPAAMLRTSAQLIHESGISHEYRTLVLPAVNGQGGFIGEEDIEALAPLVDDAPWYFRPFFGGNCLDPAWDALGGPLGNNKAAASKSLAMLLVEKAIALGKNASSPLL